MNQIDPRYLNKRCTKCSWHTYSFIGRDYVYCPMCGGLMEAYDVRGEEGLK